MGPCFYSIKPANNTEETGPDFPQLMVIDEYDFKAKDSVHNISFNTFPDFNPDLRFNLSWNAKSSSILSQAAIASFGFITSKELIDLFQKFSLPEYKTFKTTINHEGNPISNYYWLQFLDTTSKDLLNWHRSKFIIKKFSKNLGPITLNSYDDYIQKSIDLGSLKKIKIESLVLNSRPLHDVFYFPMTAKIYISRKMYSELVSSELTGIKYTEENSISVLETQV